MPLSAIMTDADIQALIDEGHPLVTPVDATAVQPASIDLSLSGERFDYELASYRLGDPLPDSACVRTTFNELLVEPQQTVHVGVAGKIAIPSDAVGLMLARSSITRLGLRIAPIFMNPGYLGTPPITITNAAAFPIKLVRQVRVVQLVCARLASMPRKDYAAREGKYSGENVSSSRIYTDEDIKSALNKVLGGYFPSEVVQTLT